MNVAINEIEQACVPAVVVELSEFELAIIGGGIGDVILG